MAENIRMKKDQPGGKELSTTALVQDGHRPIIHYGQLTIVCLLLGGGPNATSDEGDIRFLFTVLTFTAGCCFTIAISPR
jgi:hypothetical protein